jgi:hypothetical protein
MHRTLDSIQGDIASTVRELQALRRAQVAGGKSDPIATARRIYELTRKLDTLYAEKRAVNAPPTILTPDPLTKEPAALSALKSLFAIP